MPYLTSNIHIAVAPELLEALKFYVDDRNWLLNGPLDGNSGNFTGGPARAAIAKAEGAA
jgi:hypothetical protein